MIEEPPNHRRTIGYVCRMHQIGPDAYHHDPVIDPLVDAIIELIDRLKILAVELHQRRQP